LAGGGYRADVASKLDQLPTQEMRESLLAYVLRHRSEFQEDSNRPLFPLQWFEKIEAIALESGDQKLIEQIAAERQLAESVEAAWKIRSAEIKRESEAKYAPERMLQQQAQQRLRGILEVVRNSTNT
jgi:hypothetical protein